MGNLVADAMRRKYPGVDAALTNSGGLRADLVCTPPTAGEQPGEITWGEVFAVLPFGNRTVIETLTGAQLTTAFLNGFTPVLRPDFAGGTGRFPQVSGLKVAVPLHRHDARRRRDVEGAERRRADPLTPIGPTDTVRFVTNDFMYTGGDGYTVVRQGTDVQQPGDALLDIVIDYITAHPPIDAASRRTARSDAAAADRTARPTPLREASHAGPASARVRASQPSIERVTPALEATLKNLPDRPGVYLLKDDRGRVLYVGKAQSLRNRVRQYWQKATPAPLERHRIERSSTGSPTSSTRSPTASARRCSSRRT